MSQNSEEEEKIFNMEDEFCQVRKFGYCKFQENCKTKHLEGVCDSLSRVENIKYCHKSIPKDVKDFSPGKTAYLMENVHISTRISNQIRNRNK